MMSLKLVPRDSNDFLLVLVKCSQCIIIFEKYLLIISGPYISVNHKKYLAADICPIFRRDPFHNLRAFSKFHNNKDLGFSLLSTEKIQMVTKFFFHCLKIWEGNTLKPN